ALAASHLERCAFCYFEDQGGEFVIGFGQVLRDAIHGALVVILQSSSQRVREHSFSEAVNKLTSFLLEQQVLKFRRSREHLAARKLAGGVDCKIAFLFAPGADRVEVLEPKA